MSQLLFPVIVIAVVNCAGRNRLAGLSCIQHKDWGCSWGRAQWVYLDLLGHLWRWLISDQTGAARGCSQIPRDQAAQGPLDPASHFPPTPRTALCLPIISPQDTFLLPWLTQDEEQTWLMAHLWPSWANQPSARLGLHSQILCFVWKLANQTISEDNSKRRQETAHLDNFVLHRNNTPLSPLSELFCFYLLNHWKSSGVATGKYSCFREWEKLTNQKHFLALKNHKKAQRKGGHKLGSLFQWFHREYLIYLCCLCNHDSPFR